MNKGIEQGLSLMHRIMASIRIKKSKKIPRRDDQVRKLRLLIKRVILSKYLISKVTYKDLDAQIQGVKTPNKCVRIKRKVHVCITCEHIVTTIKTYTGKEIV